MISLSSPLEDELTELIFKLASEPLDTDEDIEKYFCSFSAGVHMLEQKRRLNRLHKQLPLLTKKVSHYLNADSQEEDFI